MEMRKPTRFRRARTAKAGGGGVLADGVGIGLLCGKKRIESFATSVARYRQLRQTTGNLSFEYDIVCSSR